MDEKERKQRQTELVTETLVKLHGLEREYNWLNEIEKDYRSFAQLIRSKKDLNNFSIARIIVRDGDTQHVLDVNCHFGIDPTSIGKIVEETAEKVRCKMALIENEILKYMKVPE